MQSDWHQKGRKEGYQTPMTADEQTKNWPATVDMVKKGVPDAPFKSSWHELALKRMIKHAADNGYDQVAWTPGGVQAERYDLSKHIDDMHVHRTGDDFAIGGNKDGVEVLNTSVKAGKLAETVGKDLADKILKLDDGEATTFDTPDLKVGGEGMKGFYDKMLPAAANKLGKKFGAKVGTAQFGLPMKGELPMGAPGRFQNMQDMQDAHSLPITDAMRSQAVNKGFPLFSNPKEAAAPLSLAGLGHEPFSIANRNDNPYWNPISPVKLRTPIADMKYTAEPGPQMVPRKEMTPEDMAGNWIVPMIGDRSSVGHITSIGGNPTDVTSYGGMDFMRTHAPENTAWANAKGPATGIQNAVNTLGETAPVLGSYTAMGGPSIDYSTMMSDAIMDQMRNAPVSQAAKSSFDEFMRRPVKESGGDVNLSDWPGLDSPDARDVLHNRGQMRKYLAKKMEKAQWGALGFPDIPQTRVALSHPGLLDYRRGTSGFNIARMQPGAPLVTDMKTQHPTYPVGIPGKYEGSLRTPLSRDVMFSTGAAKRRAMGADPFRDAKSLESSPLGWATFADQQWLDNAMRGYEARSK